MESARGGDALGWAQGHVAVSSTMKTCVTCSQTWPLSCFTKNSRHRDGLADMCKECKKKASRKHYLRHREAIKKRALERLKPHARQLRAIRDAAKSVPCADCGGRWPPYVMDFDHIDGTNKLFNVSAKMHTGCSVEALRAEIAKCEVVCANCHRERTHRRWLDRTAAKQNPARFKQERQGDLL